MNFDNVKRVKQKTVDNLGAGVLCCSSANRSAKSCLATISEVFLCLEILTSFGINRWSQGSIRTSVCGDSVFADRLGFTGFYLQVNNERSANLMNTLHKTVSQLIASATSKMEVVR